MKAHTYEHILHAVANQPWAIQESKFRQIEALLHLRAAGGQVPEEQVAAIVAAARQNGGPSRAGMVAVIPVYGVISHRMDMMTEMSGGTSTTAVAKAFRQAMADPDVTGIVLDIDSPGGGVSGVVELADELFAARGQKRVVALSNTTAASAAYWLGSQADEFIVSPSGEVGSIGVFCLLENWAKWYEENGIQQRLIRYGDNKAEINDFEEPAPEALAYLQDQVDEVGETFVKAVARGRGVSVADVKSTFGQGRTFFAKSAVKIGMADRVGTFEDAIRSASRALAKSTGARAEKTQEFEAAVEEAVRSAEALALRAQDTTTTPEFDAALEDAVRRRGPMSVEESMAALSADRLSLAPEPVTEPPASDADGVAAQLDYMHAVIRRSALLEHDGWTA